MRVRAPLPRRVPLPRPYQELPWSEITYFQVGALWHGAFRRSYFLPSANLPSVTGCASLVTAPLGRSV